MIKKINFFFKIFYYNFLLILFFILLIEVFFGYWFDQNNLGPFMREHRLKNQQISWEYKGEKINYNYKKNYYGFRGDDVNPSKIDAIIMGGSVIDERYKPDKYTITGFLNKKLKENNINIEILNAGVEAQSTKGIISSFDNWLYKIEGFNPKFIIIYLGINDILKENDNLENLTDGHLKNPNNYEAFLDNIKSRSFFYDNLRKFKFKFLKTNSKFIKYDGKPSLKYLNDYNFIEYSNYSLTTQDKIIVKSYLARIDTIYKKIKKLNSEVIFIPNIASHGFVKETLIKNTALIEHCKLKNYNCIDFAKKLIPKKEYWYDEVHTTKEGSEEIARLISIDLIKILKN